MDATNIIVEIMDVVGTIFVTLLDMSATLVSWLFDWSAHPYNVVIAIPLALMLIVFVVQLVRRLIDGV